MKMTFREEPTEMVRNTDSVAESSTESVVNAPPQKLSFSERRPELFRLLRGIGVLFCALGLFSGLVFGITGGSLSDWFGVADFKSAYSPSNFTYLKGSAAAKVGSLALAVESARRLNVSSDDLKDLRQQILQAAIDRKEFSFAVKAISIPYSGIDPQRRYDCQILAQALLKTKGLTGARQFNLESVDETTLRTELDDAILIAAIGSHFDEVRVLARTLPSESQQVVAGAMTAAFSARKIFTMEGFQWAKKAPGDGYRNANVLRRMHLMPGSNSQDSAMFEFVNGALQSAVPEAKGWITEMPRSSYKDMLLDQLFSTTIDKKMVTEAFATIDQVTVEGQRGMLNRLAIQKWLSIEAKSMVRAKLAKIPAPPAVKKPVPAPEPRVFYYEGPKTFTDTSWTQ